MRLLVVYKFYWPDNAPYAPILKEILENLVRDGHDVTVLTAQPSYNKVGNEKSPRRETKNGVEIKRVPLFPEKKSWFAVRLVNYVLFLTWTFFFAIFRSRKFDLVMFNSTPAILMGLWGQLTKATTGIPYLYHCQDMHPESARVVGKFKNQTLYNLLQKIDSRTCKESFKTIVLCEDMKNSLLERGVPEERISVISNFSTQTHQLQDQELPYPFDTKENSRFRLLFAGNHGNFQALDQIVAAALLLKDQEAIHFAFMGEGLAKERIMQKAKDLIGKTVTFIPFQTSDVAYTCLGRSELGIVSLSPKVHKYAFPSKTLKYCDAGCPILAVMEQESDLARLVSQEEIGFSCSQDDPQAIAQTILNAYHERNLLTEEKRNSIRKVGEAYFGRENILATWSQMLRDFESRQVLQTIPKADDENSTVIAKKAA